MSISQERRQNFGSGGHSARMYSSKTFKNFENFIKYLHKTLKIFQNCSKIQFNRINENLNNFKEI